MAGLSLAKVLKANPYHDERGRFATHDGAKFVSIGGIFDRQRALAASRATKPKTSGSDLQARRDAARQKLERYVDFDAPIRRINETNEDLLRANAERKKYGLAESDDGVPLIPVPVDGQGFDGISEAEINEAFSAEKVSVYMAMKRATVLKILAGDTIKNSLETGRGTFKTIGEARAEREKAFLGVRADVSDPSGFPKYGFVGNKSSMDDDGIVGFGYGDVYIEFDDKVRERTTVTIGDSFNNNSSVIARVPAPIDAVGGQQFQGDVPQHYQRAKSGLKAFRGNGNKNTGNIRDLAETAEYIEAQMYGPLGADTISRIHVESKKTAKAIQSAIKKHGLNIEVVPTKKNTILKDLAEGYLEAWDKISPMDLPKLGDSYIEKGWTVGTGGNLWAAGWKAKLPQINVPKAKEAMAKYPKATDVPIPLRREIMVEYLTEARKGADGSFPKALWLKKSTRDGFTDDVFNTDLLERYT